MLARRGPRRRALDPHRGRDHRAALRHGGALMASAESVAAVIEAGGAHVPELMERLEARLQELARSHGAVLAEHAGATIAAGGKRLRPLLVFVAAGAGSATTTPCCAPPWRWSWCTRRRSSTTTCSTRRRCGAAGRRSWRPRGARWRPPRATCCSRAPSPSWRRGGRAEAVRVLSDASSALAQGELLQREDAWNIADHTRALPGALRSQDRAAVRGRVPARRAGRRRVRGRARALRPRHRPRVPAARRRARRLRAGRADGQAPRHRPARRHRHAPADPRHGARSRAGSASI